MDDDLMENLSNIPWINNDQMKRMVEMADPVEKSQMMKTLKRMNSYEANKTAVKGANAPDAAVHLIDEPQKPCRLLDFKKENRPLVLNFGSCS